MSKVRVLAWWVVACVVASGPSFAVDPDDIPELVDRAAAKALENGAVGLSIAVAVGDDIVVEKGYGLAEVEHGVSVQAESPFRIASITKQFTAALVLRQIEEGKLALDDPIADLTGFDTGEHTVTVRQLLTHTSGIPSYTSLGADWERTIALELPPDELLALVEGKPFDFDPGTDFRYNNTGYFLLGVLLERLVDMPFGDIVREEITAPLGLAHTRIGSNRDVVPNRAQGYAREGGVLRNDALLGLSQPFAAGALLSTAGDLLRWWEALSSGRVVSEASFVAMTTPATLADGSETDYGFGLARAEFEGLDTIGHGGGINGFSTTLDHYPEADVTIAVLSNCESFGAASLANDIGLAVHGIERVVEDLPVPVDVSSRVVGRYEFSAFPMVMEVRAHDEQLFTFVEGQGEVRVLRQADGRYRASFDPTVVIVFSDGEPAPSLVLHQGGGQFEATRLEN